MDKKHQEFNAVFKAYYAQLHRFAHLYVSDSDECYDIVSSAYEDLWTDFGHMKTGNLRALLYRMVRNKCVDHLRRQGTRQQYAALAQKLGERFTDADTLAEEDERLNRVRQVLSNLQPPTLDIFKACYLEQKKYQEVADEMGISLSTVKKHMVRALRIIREKYLKNASQRNPFDDAIRYNQKEPT